MRFAALLVHAAAVCSVAATATAQNLTTLIVPDSSESENYRLAFAGDNPQDRAFVRLLADGAVRGEVTQQSQTGTATDSVGVQATSTILGFRTDATFLVSVVGTADDVTESYGRALLAPASGSTLSAGLIDVRLHDILGDLDVRAYGSVSTSDWATSSSEVEAEPVSDGVLGAGFLSGARSWPDGWAQPRRPR